LGEEKSLREGGEFSSSAELKGVLPQEMSRESEETKMIKYDEDGMLIVRPSICLLDPFEQIGIEQEEEEEGGFFFRKY
jgi:hypothetical protein